MNIVKWPIFWMGHLFFWNWAAGVACIFFRLALCQLLHLLLFSPILKAVFSPYLCKIPRNIFFFLSACLCLVWQSMLLQMTLFCCCKIQLSYFKSWKMMLWKCCTQCASKFRKLSSGHRTGKGQFSFQAQRQAMPKSAQTTAQLHSSHALVR